MHAILQKHQLRPATQPSSARTGKPAGTALPPPGPTAPRVPSRQRSGRGGTHGEILVALDGHLDGHHSRSSHHAGADMDQHVHGTRMIHSSSGRKFCLSSVEDLLTSSTPVQPYYLPRPGTQGSDTGGGLLNSVRGRHQQHQQRLFDVSSGGGIPRLASAAANDTLPPVPTGQGALSLGMHQALAQEIAKMVRQLPHGTSAASTEYPLPSYSGDSRNSFRHYQQQHGARSASTDYHLNGRAASPPSVSYHHQSDPNGAHSNNAGGSSGFATWAAFAAQASQGEVMSLLKLVLVRLLSGAQPSGLGPATPMTPSGRSGRTHFSGATPSHAPPRGPSQSAVPTSASAVFHSMCVAFAEATGEAPPVGPTGGPTMQVVSPRGGVAVKAAQSASAHPQEVMSDPDELAPHSDGAWQPSPRMNKQHHQSVAAQNDAFGPRHTSVRILPEDQQQTQMSRNFLSEGNEHALVSDAVLFRQIGILRRERDDMRREVEELRAELTRQLARPSS